MIWFEIYCVYLYGPLLDWSEKRKDNMRGKNEYEEFHGKTG